MIPWTTLLRHAPTILAAADALVARSRPSSGTADAVRDIDGRLAGLEQRSADTAQVVQEIAQQVNALTAAQAQSAKRVRMVLVLAVSALVLALTALLVVLV